MEESGTTQGMAGAAEKVESCKNCGKEVRMMQQKNTGFCSPDCEKRHYHGLTTIA